MTPFKNPEVGRVFEAYPTQVRKQMLSLRELILTTAASTEGVGEIEEALKWGEPAYLTSGARAAAPSVSTGKKPALRSTPCTSTARPG